MVAHSEGDRGPMLDRIDLHVAVPTVAYKEMRGEEQGASSAEMRASIECARRIQQQRRDANAQVPPSCCASSAGRTMPASARWRWPCAGSAFPPARTTGSSRSPVSLALHAGRPSANRVPGKHDADGRRGVGGTSARCLAESGDLHRGPLRMCM